MQANRIKKIKVKVKEKPWQFFITMCSFLLLAVLICGSIMVQNLRVRKMSKEQQSVLMKETGALRDNMELEMHQLTEKLSQKERDLTESEEILRELSESYTTAVETHLPGEIQKLTEHIATLKEEISTSQTTIQTIEKEMMDGNSESDEALRAAVDEMTEMIKLIDVDMEGSLDAIHEMIEGLKGENTKEAEELSAKLMEIEKKITDKTDSGISETSALLKDFVKDCTALNENLTEQMKQNFSEQNSKMSENQQLLLSNMGDVKNAVGSGFDSLSALMGTDNRALLEQIGALHEDNRSMSEQIAAVKQNLGTIDSELSQVFQSVSNGKKILASALLTKGVTVSEDAAFEDMKNAILEIDQSLLLEEGSVQGKISYEYHYHEDGGGNRVDDDMLPAVEGCFTAPVYHVHAGNPETGGGCYTTPVPHKHTGSIYAGGGCYTLEEPILIHCTYMDYLAMYSDNRTCPKCGSYMFCSKESYNPNTKMYSYFCKGEHNGEVERYLYSMNCGKNEGDVDGYTVNCSKQPGETIDGYGPGCGMAHGQITKATIIFDKP